MNRSIRRCDRISAATPRQPPQRLDAESQSVAWRRRRREVVISLFVPVLATGVRSVRAQEAELETSPLIQELLKRTEETREAREKELLEDYNRRNFKDFFSVAVDSGELTEETREKVKQWLKDNK